MLSHLSLCCVLILLQGSRALCPYREVIHDLKALIEELGNDQIANCRCNLTTHNVDSKTGSNECLCLPVPQESCNISCFVAGFETVKTTLQNRNNYAKIIEPQRKSLKRFIKMDQKYACEKTCDKVQEKNMMGFLNQLRMSFQQIISHKCRSNRRR